MHALRVSESGVQAAFVMDSKYAYKGLTKRFWRWEHRWWAVEHSGLATGRGSYVSPSAQCFLSLGRLGLEGNDGADMADEDRLQHPHNEDPCPNYHKQNGTGDDTTPNRRFLVSLKG